MEFKTNIAKAIASCGYSLRELSALTGIPHSSLCVYATGKVERMPMDRLKKLADVLHKTPAYLLGLEEDKEDEEDGLAVLTRLWRRVPKEKRADLLALIESALKMQGLL